MYECKMHFCIRLFNIDLNYVSKIAFKYAFVILQLVCKFVIGIIKYENGTPYHFK